MNILGKTLRIPLLFLGLFMFMISAAGNSSIGEEGIQIKVSGFSSTNGQVMIALFQEDQSAGFPREDDQAFLRKMIRLDELSIDGDSAEFFLTREILPEGIYGIVLFHDENSNQTLDSNALGWPLERFGFSNNPRLYFGPPGFERAKFSHAGFTQVSISLRSIF